MQFAKVFWVRVLLVLSLFISIDVLAADKTLRVGFNPLYKPIAYKENGELTGIEYAMARTVGDLLGMKVQFVELPTEDLISALVNDQIDVVMSGMSITENRKKLVSFTDSYMEVGQMAIIHADKVVPLALPRAMYRPGMRVGVEPTTTGADYARDFLSEAVVSFYDGQEAAFDALEKDLIDYYIHDAPTSWNLSMGKQTDTFLPLYRMLTREQLAWAVRKEDTMLLARLNGALADMKASRTLNQILDYWLPVKVELE
ncbi:MAG: ABC transporter substrate-binding protein [Pseudomonadales bacterium]